MSSINLSSSGSLFQFEDDGSFNIKKDNQNIMSLDPNFLTLPSGNTAQRPSATQGTIRYNTETNKIELYDGLNWVNVI